MSMKKKLKVGAVILGIVLVILVIFLCYKAQIHMAEQKAEKERLEREAEEAMVTPLPTELPVTPTLVPQMAEQPEEGNDRTYQFQKFKQLSEVFTKKQIKELQDSITDYLHRSRIHEEASKVTCTDFFSRSQTRNQIYGYVELDDGNLLQYTYDFDSEVVKVMETAVTLQNLEEKKRQEKEAEKAAEEERKKQEEENRRKEALAQEIFNQNEGGTAATPAPQQQQYQTYVPSYSQNSGSVSYPSTGNTGGLSQEELEAQIQAEQIPDGEGIPDEEEDLDAVLEEEIPEDVFTDD